MVEYPRLVIKSLKSNWFMAIVLIALSGISACLANLSYGFFYKAAVAALGGLAIVWLYRHSISKNRDVVFIITAFIFSIIGDWFLSHRDDQNTRFIWGIFFFFLAHAGYLCYSLYHGKPSYIFTIIVLGLFCRITT